MTAALPDVLRKLLAPSLAAMVLPHPMVKGECLFLQRQRPRHMYFVVEGEVVLDRMGEQGQVIVLQRVRQGFVAEASLQSASYHCDARVTLAGHAMALPIEPLKAALMQDTAFAQRWIAMLSTEVRRLRGQCERLSQRGVRERLLHLIETEGVDGRLAVASGLKSLAMELAVTHEALYRALAVLEQEGIVSRTPGNICLRGRGAGR